MKDILIVLLVIALCLLIVGAANSGVRVDLDYVFGTWHQVSLFTLVAIAVAALVVVGLAAAAFEGIHAARDRRKLERELERTYGRLRETEARLAELDEQRVLASSSTSFMSVAAPSATTLDEDAPRAAEEDSEGPRDAPAQGELGQEPGADDRTLVSPATRRDEDQAPGPADDRTAVIGAGPGGGEVGSGRDDAGDGGGVSPR